jgi:hypothetical protein
MKKFLIKNISTASLEFLVKDNEVDVLMSLKPGESCYADSSYTNSMRIFERKNLISIKEEEYTPTIEEEMDVNNDETLDRLHITQDTKVVVNLIDSADTINFQVYVKPKPTLEYVNLNFNVLPTGTSFGDKSNEEKKEKSYKGKKRGRKKKRGPKPGNKKKKNDNNTNTNE